MPCHSTPLPSSAVEAALSPKQAARFVGVGLSTFWPLIHSGAIPAFRVGRLIRIRPEDLRAFVAEQRDAFAASAGRAS